MRPSPSSPVHVDAPRCLGPFTSTGDVPGQRALRSAGIKRLAVPSVRLSTVGSRAFPVAAAQIWNSLPEQIVSAPTLHVKKNCWLHIFYTRQFLTPPVTALKAATWVK